MTVQGAGINSTVVQSPATWTCFDLGGGPRVPVVYIHDANPITIKNLEVDGDNKGALNNRFIGIAFVNAGGTVSYDRIDNLQESPANAGNETVGILFYNNDSTSRTINVNYSDIHAFQKNAMALIATSTTPLVFDIQHNTITGRGVLPSGDNAQNGIQVQGLLGTGTIAYNNLSAIAYEGPGTCDWVATSILNYYANLNIHHNTVSGQVGMYDIDAPGQINDNTVTLVKANGCGWGIAASDPPGARPSPLTRWALAWTARLRLRPWSSTSCGTALPSAGPRAAPTASRRMRATATTT